MCVTPPINRKRVMMNCSNTKSARVLTFLFIIVTFVGSLTADSIDVDGVGEEGVYTDFVEFTVNTEAGYTYDIVTLNDDPIATDTLIVLNYAEYFLLYVHRINDTTFVEDSLTIQFIIRDSERLFSEVGLPAFTPYPPIDSAAAEYVGATLNIVTPANYPMGLEIPVAARVNDGSGKRQGVIGNVTAAGFEGYPLKLLRGVGHVFLPAETAPGTVNYNAAIHSLSTPKTINIEASTTWVTKSGTINSDTNWGTNARIHVNAELIIAAGAELTIGAGSVIKIDPDLEIIVDGSIDVNGTSAEPVTFTTDDRNVAWGGFLFENGTTPSIGNFSWTIMTASGGSDIEWLRNSGHGGSHRLEQPLLYLGNGADVTLTDCYLIDHVGQAGRGKGDSNLTMERCLVQQFVSCGQYNGGRVDISDSALLEFPAWDAPFTDLDNDGLYMVGGAHFFTNTIIGWALDDGLDAGSGIGGDVTLIGCWLESSYHEAMAWSTNNPPTRVIGVTDTVTMNCGQGIEAGFGEPIVTAVRCFSTGNAVGVRFGDNYARTTYDGLLDISDSLLLYNLRDVWGFTRYGGSGGYWTISTGKMDIETNYLSVPDPYFPTNTLWDPITTPSQADLLIPFLPTPATTVGIGLGTYQDTVDITDLPGNGIPGGGIGVRLSTFTTNIVSINYTIEIDGGPYASGSLQFAPGQTVREIPFAPPVLKAPQEFDVSISAPVNADITGFQQITVTVPALPYKIEKDIIAVGDDWLYRKGTSEPPSDWNELGFTPDGTWDENGTTPIGYETDPPGNSACLATDLTDMKNNYLSVYARYIVTIDDPSEVTEMGLLLDFDDGYIAYINGDKVGSENLPDSAGYLVAATTSNHEAYCEGGSVPIDLTGYISLLVPGENVFAFQIHNKSYTSSDFMFASAVTIVTAPMPGDVEPDGDIDIDDLAAMAISWLANSGDVNYNFYCDIDDVIGDGTVNLPDFQVLAENWMEGL